MMTKYEIIISYFIENRLFSVRVISSQSRVPFRDAQTININSESKKPRKTDSGLDDGHLSCLLLFCDFPIAGEVIEKVDLRLPHLYEQLFLFPAQPTLRENFIGLSGHAAP